MGRWRGGGRGAAVGGWRCERQLTRLRPGRSENLYIVKTLKEFQYIDEFGKDQGANGQSTSSLKEPDPIAGTN